MFGGVWNVWGVCEFLWVFVVFEGVFGSICILWVFVKLVFRGQVFCMAGLGVCGNGWKRVCGGVMKIILGVCGGVMKIIWGVCGGVWGRV